MSGDAHSAGVEAAALMYASTVSGAYNRSKNEWYRHAEAIVMAYLLASGAVEMYDEDRALAEEWMPASAPLEP